MLPIDFDEKCAYLNDNIVCNHNSKKYISNLKVYCKKFVPITHFYKEQISSYNHTVHNMLMDEISMILQNFPKDREEKRSIIALSIIGFIGLAYEDISSYLHNKIQKALHKASIAMENKINLQCNKIIHLEDPMVMYGIYNSETLEKLITTEMHNSKPQDEKLFASKLMLSLSISHLLISIIIKTRKQKLFTGHLLSNVVKIMLFISDTQYYVPIKLCRMAGSIHLFKITGTLTPENVKLKQNILWDIRELDWKEVNVTLNGNKINLPTSFKVKFRDKFKIRHIAKREPLLFHIMLKQGMTWFTLASNNPSETA